MCSTPYGMGKFSKTQLNPTHFYTDPNFYWLFEKTSSSCFVKNLKCWKKVLFGDGMWERDIFDPLGPNISLPDRIGRCTHIQCHQKSYIHIIIYIGFYLDPWYWKYNQTHSRRQVPWRTGERKIWLILKRPHSNCDNLFPSKSEASSSWRMNMTFFCLSQRRRRLQNLIILNVK